jgi:hypothetical protein
VFSKYTRDRDLLNYLSCLKFLESRISNLGSRISSLESQVQFLQPSCLPPQSPKNPARTPRPRRTQARRAQAWLIVVSIARKLAPVYAFTHQTSSNLPKTSTTIANVGMCPPTGWPEPQRLRSSFWRFLREIQERNRCRRQFGGAQG